jgi:hypothetical protein
MEMANSEDYLRKVMYYFLTLTGQRELRLSSLKGFRIDLCRSLNERIETILSYFKDTEKSLITFTDLGKKDQCSSRYYVDNRVVSFASK